MRYDAEEPADEVVEELVAPQDAPRPDAGPPRGDVDEADWWDQQRPVPGLDEDFPEPDHDSMRLTDVVARLHQELGGDHSLEAVAEVVRECRDDLATVHTDALPELVERLARQRLEQG